MWEPVRCSHRGMFTAAVGGGKPISTSLSLLIIGVLMCEVAAAALTSSLHTSLGSLPGTGECCGECSGELSVPATLRSAKIAAPPQTTGVGGAGILRLLR